MNRTLHWLGVNPYVMSSSSTAILQAGAIVVLILLFFPSRRYRLPPGPPGNVVGEFKNMSMPEVFEKWRQKYGTWHSTPAMVFTGLIMGTHKGRIFSFKLGTRLVVGMWTADSTC
jgi:hypothetical protein